jgi:hypothetical protein
MKKIMLVLSGFLALSVSAAASELLNSPTCHGLYDSLQLQSAISSPQDALYKDTAEKVSGDISQATAHMDPDLKRQMDGAASLSQADQNALFTKVEKYYSDSLQARWNKGPYCPSGSTPQEKTISDHKTSKLMQTIYRGSTNDALLEESESHAACRSADGSVQPGLYVSYPGAGALPALQYYDGSFHVWVYSGTEKHTKKYDTGDNVDLKSTPDSFYPMSIRIPISGSQSSTTNQLFSSFSQRPLQSSQRLEDAPFFAQIPKNCIDGQNVAKMQSGHQKGDVGGGVYGGGSYGGVGVTYGGAQVGRGTAAQKGTSSGAAGSGNTGADGGGAPIADDANSKE